LVDEYDELDKMMTKMRTEASNGISETWREEIQEMSSNLEKGARTALRRVQKVLGADMQDAPDETGGVDAKADEDMDGVELNYDLQIRLKYLERGVKRMVKGLDEEDF
jgi:hypothetical protein